MLGDYVFSFLDEFEKIAVTSAYSPFMQQRRGRRPIRVHTMLKNQAKDEMPYEKDTPTEGNTEYEAGAGLQENPMDVGGGKTAALATDLRMKGLGGVKRPPEPTEESKGEAFGMLKNTQKVGKFTAMTTPHIMTKPGPSVTQVATTPPLKIGD